MMKKRSVYLSFRGRGILIGGLIIVLSALGCSSAKTFRVYTCSGDTYISDSKIYYKNTRERAKLLHRNQKSPSSKKQ